MKKNNKNMIILIVCVIVLIFLWWSVKIAKHYPKEIKLESSIDYFGVTFSTKFAKELDLSWQSLYLEALNDLKVKNIRLPIYWDEVEKQAGIYDFAIYDYIIEEGEKRGVNFVVNVGYRLPRWPECHLPSWTNSLDQNERETKLLAYIRETVNRYKKNSSIKYWQIENEPYLNSFGICPKLNEEMLKQEVSLVKSIDNRPVIVSASGELSTWKKERKLADVLGITMYRVVYNPTFGFIRYPFGFKHYKYKSRLFNINSEDIMIMELQAEPWVAEGKMSEMSQKDIDKSLSIEQFKGNLQTAINADFKKVYLWGLEWWYLQKKAGNDLYWEIAKDLFNK